LLFFHCYCTHRYLHSFPTRRSSDLFIDAMMSASPVGLRLSKECLNMSVDAASIDAVIAMEDRNQVLCSRSEDFKEGIQAFLEKRSEEHTSELQSPCNLVCRLLLEKK